ncbi:hypothetical protein ACO0RG_002999 [Hanseniaspora osmophila]|uniref:inorganic diphosphatase n=1 Tax=Hanseniaspora osmophila TaxID=56408 RepID=A0A1E5RYV8_9ASCO|nr:Inorganic pyrophosphatase, mitochondrial [Hanseniaspora osmophila]
MFVSRRLFSSITSGTKYTPQFKQYLKLSDGKLGSFFHDVHLNPLNTSSKSSQDRSKGLSGNILNMVVEVPRWSNAKFEISKDLPLNPIVQDTKNTKLRFVNNIFPYHGYVTNYGAIPQTWENPSVNNGDNDPLDCCEIGSGILETGTVTPVKVLGSLALLDDGEMDWKVIAINVNDPLCAKINTMKDVETFMPGLLAGIRTWFKTYKIPTNKPANEFAFDGEYLSLEKTMSVVQECHEEWEGLMKLSSNVGQTTGHSVTTERFATYDLHESSLPNLNAREISQTVEFDQKWYYC